MSCLTSDNGIRVDIRKFRQSSFLKISCVSKNNIMEDEHGKCKL